MTPPLSLSDLAAQCVMAVTVAELTELTQTAIREHGFDVLDHSVGVPGSREVVTLGGLIARCADWITR